MKIALSLLSGLSYGAVTYFRHLIPTLARTAKVLEKLGVRVYSFPLSAYRDRLFYSMRTDALDPFGTKLERRFTKEQIQVMMEHAGLENIEFSQKVPFWCAVGYKK